MEGGLGEKGGRFGLQKWMDRTNSRKPPTAIAVIAIIIQTLNSLARSRSLSAVCRKGATSSVDAYYILAYIR